MSPDSFKSSFLEACPEGAERGDQLEMGQGFGVLFVSLPSQPTKGTLEEIQTSRVSMTITQRNKNKNGANHQMDKTSETSSMSGQSNSAGRKPPGGKATHNMWRTKAAQQAWAPRRACWRKSTARRCWPQCGDGSEQMNACHQGMARFGVCRFLSPLYPFFCRLDGCLFACESAGTDCPVFPMEWE